MSSTSPPDWVALACNPSVSARGELIAESRSAILLWRRLRQGEWSDSEYQMLLDALFL